MIRLQETCQCRSLASPVSFATEISLSRAFNFHAAHYPACIQGPWSSPHRLTFSVSLPWVVSDSPASFLLSLNISMSLLAGEVGIVELLEVRSIANPRWAIPMRVVVWWCCRTHLRPRWRASQRASSVGAAASRDLPRQKCCGRENWCWGLCCFTCGFFCLMSYSNGPHRCRHWAGRSLLVVVLLRDLVEEKVHQLVVKTGCCLCGWWWSSVLLLQLKQRCSFPLLVPVVQEVVCLCCSEVGTPILLRRWSPWSISPSFVEAVFQIGDTAAEPLGWL